jgi:hypothetical protein
MSPSRLTQWALISGVIIAAMAFLIVIGLHFAARVAEMLHSKVPRSAA